MRYSIILILGLCLLLPLSSALTFDEVTSIGELQDYALEDAYIISPEKIYFGEEFSFVVGVAVNSSLNASRTIVLEGVVIEPIISAVNTPEGDSFAIYEWVITPWRDSESTLRIEMDGIVTFSKDIDFSLDKRVPVNSQVIDSEIVEEVVVSDDNELEARVALAKAGFQYSSLEFELMQELALEQFVLEKKIEKIVETYDDNSSATKTKVVLVAKAKDGFGDQGIDIIEVISKDAASHAYMIKSSPQAQVIKEDPVIMWHVSGVESEVTYEIQNDVDVTGNTVVISSLTAPEEKQSFPWKVAAPLLIIPLIAGFIVFFARFEPKTKK